MRDVVPAVLPRTLSEFQERRPGAVMPKPWHAAMLVGRCHHMEVWLGCERHLYVVGPARSGKTVCVVIPAVVEAPGSSLPPRRAATSSRRPVPCASLA